MEITANAVQTVAANQNVLFTETPIRGNCSIIHREGSGLVTLRGITDQCRARFRVSFGANVAIPTGGAVVPIELAIAINGEAIGPATMISTPAAVANFNNVYTSIFLDVPAGCCYTISVTNIGADAIEVENANLIVERVA
jgi:hypothetical protein